MKKTEVPHLKISASGNNKDKDSFDQQFFYHTWILSSCIYLQARYCWLVQQFRKDIKLKIPQAFKTEISQAEVGLTG